jgi:uncharacterized membrane protein YdfJ with MMPL/SSD domain
VERLDTKTNMIQRLFEATAGAITNYPALAAGLIIAVGFSLIGAIFLMPAILSLMGRFTQPAPGGHEQPEPETA